MNDPHMQEKIVNLNTAELLGPVEQPTNARNGGSHSPEGNDFSTETQGLEPFDKVVLVKDIDNQVLTSFRTLRGDNNSLSETQKVLHRKFLPQIP